MLVADQSQPTLIYRLRRVAEWDNLSKFLFVAHWTPPPKSFRSVTISLLLMGCAGAEGPCALKSGDGACPIYVRVADLILPALKLLNDGFRNQMLRHPHYRPVASCQILPVARKTSAFASESDIYERV
jgi:hypothetical protein